MTTEILTEEDTIEVMAEMKFRYPKKYWKMILACVNRCNQETLELRDGEHDEYFEPVITKIHIEQMKRKQYIEDVRNGKLIEERLIRSSK